MGAAAAASGGEEVAPKTEREVDPNLSGVLEGGQPVEQSETKAVDSTVSYQSSSLRQILFLVLAIFITLAAYYAMVLTNWATIQSNSSLSDPRYGTVALWINASGQWIALLIYAWSLVASRIFPDRDFS